MCRHIYDWNIVNCDVKQPFQLKLNSFSFENYFLCFMRFQQQMSNYTLKISIHEHWENVFILLIVWLVVMGFRQNFPREGPVWGGG